MYIELLPLKRCPSSTYLSVKPDESLDEGELMVRDCDAVRFVGIGETAGRGTSASGYRWLLGTSICILLGFLSEFSGVITGLVAVDNGSDRAAEPAERGRGMLWASVGVSGGESGSGMEVGDAGCIGAGFGDGACEGSGVGVGDLDMSPMANEARSLSSSVVRPTGLSSRSGCGELALARTPSDVGEI